MTERLSAVMDGEIDGPECAGCLDRLKDDPDLRATWSLYHLVGDAIRGEAGAGLPAEFGRRLAAEPTILAPRRVERRATRAPWYALSAAASVAAVALVGWMALPLIQPAQVAGLRTGVEPGVTLATVPPASVPVAQGVNDYLLAHQRFSPSSALGGMAPYIRTVSEANGAR